MINFFLHTEITLVKINCFTGKPCYRNLLFRAWGDPAFSTPVGLALSVLSGQIFLLPRLAPIALMTCLVLPIPLRPLHPG